MNSDESINALILDLSRVIEKYSDRIDTVNLLGALIGLCHMTGDTLGYRRKDFNHILKELINKRYME
jgi:hypothetical protein